MWKKIVGWPLMTLTLAACVTINIYFPAAAAEEAARTIVRDVLGKEGAMPDEDAAKPEPDDKQSNNLLPKAGYAWIGHVLEVMVPTAEAAQADININTPAVSRLRSSMASRQSRLSPYYRAGAIGFDQNAMVSIRDLSAVSLKERNSMKKLVADENDDRDALYREIARANGHPEWEKDVRNTFARVWVEEAPSGYWYIRSGSWAQK